MVIFKPVPNHAHYYAGSDGWIYSDRLRGFEKKSRGLRKLKPGLNNQTRYYYVNIENDQGVYKTQRVHRIVCSAFHGVPANESDTASHLDGNRTNNIPENLKWESIQENLKRKKEHGTDDLGYRSKQAHLDQEKLLRIRSFLNEGALTHQEIADIFKVGRITITRINNGVRYKGQ